LLKKITPQLQSDDAAARRPHQRVAAARLVHYGGAIGIEVFAKALNALR